MKKITENTKKLRRMTANTYNTKMLRLGKHYNFCTKLRDECNITKAKLIENKAEWLRKALNYLNELGEPIK